MKRFSDHTEKEFLLLRDAEIKEIIEQEIDFFQDKDKERSNYIKDVILFRFERKFYTGSLRNTLYKDLKLDNSELIDFHKKEKEKQRVERENAKNKLENLEENKRRDTPERRYLRILRDQLLMSVLLDIFTFNALKDIFPFLNDENEIIAFFIFALISYIFLEIYFLPWNISWARKHPSAWGILVVNIVFGWTFIVWIIDLIWAVSQIEQRVVLIKEKDLK